MKLIIMSGFLLSWSLSFCKDKATLITSSEEAANIRWDLIEQETEHIILDFHIFDGSRFGGLTLAKLIEKAKQGVKVQIIFDGLFPLHFIERAVDPAMTKLLNESGIEIRTWNPANSQKLSTILNLQKLKRSHDKIMWFRSQKLAAIGDRNWQNVNVRMGRKESRKGKSYHSLDVVVEGSTVDEIKTYLDKIWNLSEPIDTSKVSLFKYNLAKKAMEKYQKIISRLNPPSGLWRKSMNAIRGIQFLKYNPLRKGKDFDFDQSLLDLINHAEDKLVIATPFLRLPKIYRKALRRAAKRPNLKIKIITADETNHVIPISHLIYEKNFHELKDLPNIEFYSIKGEDMWHAKFVLADDKMYLGTHNLNMRSSYLDLETGFLIEDRELVNRVRTYIAPIIGNEKNKFKPKASILKSCLSALVELTLRLPIIKLQP